MKTMSSEIVSFNISPKGFYELFIMKEGSAAISPETKGLETFASNNGGGSFQNRIGASTFGHLSLLKPAKHGSYRLITNWHPTVGMIIFSPRWDAE